MRAAPRQEIREVDVVAQSPRKMPGKWGTRIVAVPGYGYRLRDES